MFYYNIRPVPYYGYGTYNRIVDRGYHYGGYNSGADHRQEVSPSLFTRIANFISEVQFLAVRNEIAYVMDTICKVTEY